MAPTPSRFVLALVLALVSFPPGFAATDAPPSSPPWLTEIPQEIRSAVRRTLWSESLAVTKPRNEAGKQFTWFYASEYLEREGDHVSTWVTIQRCLPTHMVTERWRYDLRPEGREWKIVGRTKIGDIDDSYPRLVESPEKARPVRPFQYTRGRFTLEFRGGSGVVVSRGNRVVGILLAGEGHVTLMPPDDYSLVFFRDRLHADAVDDDIETVMVFFHGKDAGEWLERLGWDGEVLDHPGSGPRNGKERKLLARLVRRETDGIEKYRYHPAWYAPNLLDRFRGQAWIRVTTRHQGIVTWMLRPWWVREVEALHGKPGMGVGGRGSEHEILYLDYAPETLRLPPVEREERKPLRWVRPMRYDAALEIDREKRFDARVTVDLEVLLETRELRFGTGYETELHFVRDADGNELPVEPTTPLKWGQQFGRESAASFRIVFPETLHPGQRVRLSIGYSAPKLPSRTGENIFEVGMGNHFLPFGSALWEPVPVRLVVRSPDRYRHIATGVLQDEKVAGGYRETTWVSDEPQISPHVVVGEFHPPVEEHRGDLTFLAYAPVERIKRRLVSVDEDDLRRAIDQAGGVLDTLQKLLGRLYPHRVIHLVGGGWRFRRAWPPSGMAWIDERILAPAREPSEYVGSLSYQLARGWWGQRVRVSSSMHAWLTRSLADVSDAFAQQVARPGRGYLETLQVWRWRALRADDYCSLPDLDARFGSVVQARFPVAHARGPYVIHMLAQYFGYDRLQELLHLLATKYDGRELSAARFRQEAERVCGQKLDWFFDPWVRNIGHPRVHYRIGKPRPAPDGKGWIVEVKLRQERVLPQHWNPPPLVYRHLLVPFRVTPKGGRPYIAKVFLEKEEETKLLRLQGRPSKIEINPNGLMYIEADKM